MKHVGELDIVIRHKGTKVSAGIPQLALWATAGDAHAAITALEQKRAAFLADAAEAGVLEDLEIRPYKLGYAPPPRRGELRQFAAKALIVIGLIAGITALSAGLLAAKFEQLVGKVEQMVENAQAKMQQYTKVGGARFWERMEHELDRAADPASDLPAEQKRKLLAQIHTVVERWRPFMAELAPLFADFQKTAPAVASPSPSETHPATQTPNER
jgi:hypothetical protein